MPNFFKSFFSGKSETPESEKQKNDRKRFEIFKYDGLRAQRMEKSLSVPRRARELLSS